MTEDNLTKSKLRPDPLALGMTLGLLLTVSTGTPVFLGVGLGIGAMLKKRWEG